MKTIVFVCALGALFVAGAYADSVHRIPSLPIGSAEEMQTQLERVCSEVMLDLSTNSRTNSIAGHYTNTMGPLRDFIMQKMRTLLSKSVQPQDAGSEVSFVLYPEYPLWRDNKGNGMNAVIGNIRVAVKIDGTGNPILPDGVVPLPTAEFIPIQTSPEGMLEIRYLWWDHAGKLVKDAVSSPGNCWADDTTNTIFLVTEYLANEEYRNRGYHGEVRFIYKVELKPFGNVPVWLPVPSIFESFDILSGKKIDSTVLELHVGRGTQGTEVTVTGWPGKRVAMETSSDLKVWAEQGTLTLDQTGKGLCVPPSVGGPFFVRARLIP